MNTLQIYIRKYYSTIYNIFSECNNKILSKEDYILLAIISILGLAPILLYLCNRIQNVEQLVLQNQKLLESAHTKIETLIQTSQNLTLQIKEISVKKNVLIEKGISKTDVTNSVFFIFLTIAGTINLTSLFFDFDVLPNFGGATSLLITNKFDYIGIPIKVPLNPTDDFICEYFARSYLTGALIFVQFLNGDALNLYEYMNSLNTNSVSSSSKNPAFKKVISEMLGRGVSIMETYNSV